MHNEIVDKTSHDKIFILKNDDMSDFTSHLQNILDITSKGQNEEKLREAVFDLINGSESKVIIKTLSDIKSINIEDNTSPVVV